MTMTIKSEVKVTEAMEVIRVDNLPIAILMTEAYVDAIHQGKCVLIPIIYDKYKNQYAAPEAVNVFYPVDEYKGINADKMLEDVLTVTDIIKSDDKNLRRYTIAIGGQLSVNLTYYGNNMEDGVNVEVNRLFNETALYNASVTDYIVSLDDDEESGTGKYHLEVTKYDTNHNWYTDDIIDHLENLRVEVEK